MRKRLAAVSLMVIFGLFLSGCSEESTVTPLNEQKAPELPSASTMSMNLSLFESAEIDTQNMNPQELDCNLLGSCRPFRKNFLNAAVRALYLQIVVYSSLVEPVAAFTLAAHSIPQPQEDGSWLWTYVFVEDGIDYSIFLYGKPMDDYTEWRMEVSSTDPENPLSHFTWFDGLVYSGEDRGYWQFYEPSESIYVYYAPGQTADVTPGIESIRIDWENNGPHENHLEFLINKAGDPNEGSTLTFDEIDGMGSIVFYNAKDDATGTIIWHSDGSGSIEWPDYNEGELSCWDSRQFDTDCE